MPAGVCKYRPVIVDLRPVYGLVFRWVNTHTHTLIEKHTHASQYSGIDTVLIALVSYLPKLNLVC